jgi:hypothetical protein
MRCGKPRNRLCESDLGCTDLVLSTAFQQFLWKYDEAKFDEKRRITGISASAILQTKDEL